MVETFNQAKNEATISSAIAEYKKRPLTPELVNSTWQALWKKWGEKIGQVFDVPSCDRTSKELTKLKKENKAVLLIPDKVDLIVIGKIFPALKNEVVQEGNRIEDEQGEGGSVDIEMDYYSPNRNMTRGEVNKLFKRQGRNGQRLKTYIIGSQFHKLLAGFYFDNYTWANLLGSQVNGLPTGAFFDLDGRLIGGWGLSLPLRRSLAVGFRSEGKRT